MYIHNGSPKGLSTKPSQVVEGSRLVPGISGFGFSLSRGQDIDHNGYNGKKKN